MTKEILYCNECDQFTLKDKCQKCNNKTLTIKPAKYSPEDKFGDYRRKYKTKDEIHN